MYFRKNVGTYVWKQEQICIIFFFEAKKVEISKALHGTFTVHLYTSFMILIYIFLSETIYKISHQKGNMFGTQPLTY